MTKTELLSGLFNCHTSLALLLGLQVFAVPSVQYVHGNKIQVMPSVFALRYFVVQKKKDSKQQRQTSLLSTKQRNNMIHFYSSSSFIMFDDGTVRAHVCVSVRVTPQLAP